MLCLVYEFKVKPGMEDVFRSGWRSVTSSLIGSQGSLGARLHRIDESTWISYAQWPNHHAWQNGDHEIAEFLKSTHWSECLIGEVKLLLQMNVTDDLLLPLSTPDTD